MICKRNIAGLIYVFVVVTVRSHIHMDIVDAFTEKKHSKNIAFCFGPMVIFVR